ncbi:RAMP superfamily CRISPR-associated protein [Roseiflexus castenholzii]|uniref:CRISPR type III-associated protein domain-containing protein n=1 Tax=Roseiflexus castenholzii (strain DSM 13941 / HLO8) TaxID=383372 RepID=A7NP48_ROSCS|nr:RAMP superfamily CRISPR-associated protein [Roseiflexus castenholzii]ABU59344.1 protein of unknown function DUF324 [Roseiflexus castenholzii DSM 13941]
MSIRLEFEIEFKSDYHIGAGYGLGLQVDSVLLRDADGVPVIRGTVLAGLLRESLTTLLTLQVFASDQHVVDTIFGSLARQKRWRISSARPAGMMTPLVPSDVWSAGKTAAQITTRVRVNPRTRRAEKNKLFTREEGDGSLRFRFVAECQNDDADAQREAEWLVAAARMLRNLGAGKRRGYGECEIHLVDRAQETAFLDRLARRLRGEHGAEPALPAGAINIRPLPLPPNPNHHTYRLRVLMRLDEPLLIARRVEAGNQYETLDIIPGSVLRGALAWRAAKRLGQQLQGSVYQDFVNLFWRDTVRFSMLTPVEVSRQASGYPTIIAPRDLLTCELHPGFTKPSEDDGCGVWSRFESVSETCPVCVTDHGAAKLETLGGFISLVRNMPRSRHKPSTMVEMHIRIDPDSGRVRTGDLYGYVALEPGQYFVGEVTCTDANIWDALRTMANLQPNGAVNELHLGKATQRGYGKVSAVFQKIDEPLFSLQSLTERLTSTEHVTMLLLSDAIIVDPWGRFWRGFDAAWLKRELQLPNGAAVSIDCNQNGEALAFSAVRTVDSFNATLGLPRARDIAIVAGSSVRLSFKGIPLDDLRQRLGEVEAQGIGLRRNEGFGCVAFNHPVYRQLQGITSPMLDLTPLQMASAEQSPPFVAVLAFTREWEEKLEAEATSFACFNDGRFETIARLLHVSQHTSVDAIKQDLQRSGNAENLLGKSLSGRDKPNFFTADGKRGMDVIDKLLDALVDELKQHKLDHNPQAWRIGLQMLAARIAAPARQKAEERR